LKIESSGGRTLFCKRKSVKELKVIIDGRDLKATKGMTILGVAQGAGIKIPTLCHHQALSPVGSCRLCIVEVLRGKRSRLVTSCNYPIEETIEVKTDSSKVKKIRKILLEMLLARCPEVEIIQQLARDHQIEKPRFKKSKNDRCILCGLCVRICQERMGVSAINFVGRGVRRKVSTPFDTHSDVCQSCGACAFICPTGAINLEQITKHKPLPIASEFNRGLSVRSPIFLPYPQAVPSVPTIDKEVCIRLLTGNCGICKDICQAHAIDFDQKDEMMEIEAGAIILTPGFSEFDATELSYYGYGLYPNVVTSLEFERILSASGPFQGHLVRPSDHQAPKRIAWIQCVGSRDIHHANHAYCSSVCCTYAIKEAVVAQEHSPTPLETTIFLIDLRTFGKGFERYYERAKRDRGVRFIRARVTTVYQENDGDLTLRYFDEDRIKEERFSMVVLSVGLREPLETRALAERLGLDLNEHGFCDVQGFSTVTTSKPGIFVAGVFSGPKDIPETVMEASASATEASTLLASSRHQLTIGKEYPPERDVEGERPRIGVFVCHCGINIGGVLDVPGLKEYAQSLTHVVYADDTLFACAQDNQKKIQEIIREHRLNRLVVAACSPRTHEVLFQETLRAGGLNRYLFEMANIRDQCSWVHMNQPEQGTLKARDLIRMAVAKARLINPLKQISLEVDRSALVIGGGIAGMVSALHLARQEFQVHLVERTPELGGIARRHYHSLEGKDIQAYLQELIREVSQHPLIHLHKETEIHEVSGYVGNFKTRLKGMPNGEIDEIKHGVVILATGGEAYKPDEYLYGKDPRVLTLLDLKDEIEKGNPSITKSKNLVMIQCVGSREPERLYCSRVCCSGSIKTALHLKEIHPEMNIYILYRDIRTYGFKEPYYQKARDKGIIFIRYEVDEKPLVEAIQEGNQNVLRVSLKDPILGEPVFIDADVISLATAIVPASGKEEMAKFFKVPLNEDGFFMEAHIKLRPVEFPAEGVFVCGLAHNPKLIDESVAQAGAAVSKALTILSRERIEADGMVSWVDQRKCTGCGVCGQLCPFKAIDMDEVKMVAVINEALCKGCGVCASSCRSGAIDLKGFTNAEVVAQINELAMG
jgi:heterodisulfide reductase subunit A